MTREPLNEMYLDSQSSLKVQPEILSVEQELARIEAAINSLGNGIRILEAGCGRTWLLNLSVSYELVGVDTDVNALQARVNQVGDLHEFQVNDLCKAQFEPASFDVIYCSYVLEHVTGVGKVLENFARWIKPGGLLILRIPDYNSVYGFATRHTGYGLHIWIKRHIYDKPNAGKPGFGPYPVVYEPEISLDNLQRFCVRHGFDLSVTGNGRYLERRWWLPWIARACSLISLGSLAWRHNNLAIIIRT